MDSSLLNDGTLNLLISHSTSLTIENANPPQDDQPTLRSPPSEIEARIYYYGLPSRPRLVARTGSATWKEPTGPEAYPVIKEFNVVGNHALTEVWEDNLAIKLHALLDSMEVKWTSTDVVRIGIREEPSPPVILWIGVMPSSLSGHDGVTTALECRKLLYEYGIRDVDVEIRESEVTYSAGPKLLTSVHNFNPTAHVRDPLTTTLGHPICAESTPWAEGTSGFFLTEGGRNDRLLLVTARHVVFGQDKNNNNHFRHKNNSQPRHNITLFGQQSFKNYRESISTEIADKKFIVKHWEKQCLSSIESTNNPTVSMEQKGVETELEQARDAIEELEKFNCDVATGWVSSENRILGHVVLSPPIDVGFSSENYTEDWATIEIDTSKVDASNFYGNAIDLGLDIAIPKFTRMMHPNPRNAHSFTYPADRLLRLRGTIPDKEMRRPTAFDHNDEPCIMVIKRGNTTGLTIGRANNIFSYTRKHFEDDTTKTSKEWAILPFNSKSGAFSEKGDSGAVIVDGFGRIGGLLTGSTGPTKSADITYATPISFLLKRMQSKGIDKPNLNPVLSG